MLATKNIKTNDEIFKARFKVKAHTDMDKNLLVQASPNQQQKTVRILITLATISGF